MCGWYKGDMIHDVQKKMKSVKDNYGFDAILDDSEKGRLIT